MKDITDNDLAKGNVVAFAQDKEQMRIATIKEIREDYVLLRVYSDQPYESKIMIPSVSLVKLYYIPLHIAKMVQE